jgi:hypothetical protein
MHMSFKDDMDVILLLGVSFMGGGGPGGGVTGGRGASHGVRGGILLQKFRLLGPGHGLINCKDTKTKCRLY